MNTKLGNIVLAGIAGVLAAYTLGVGLRGDPPPAPRILPLPHSADHAAITSGVEELPDQH